MKTFREVAERYLKQPSRRLNREKGDSAVRYTHYAITRFGDREMSEGFKRRDVTMYVEDMREDGYANGTINARMRYFLAVLNYAKRDLELISSVPHFDKLQEHKGGRVLSDREVNALLGALPAAKAEMMRFALETGLRGANVKGLRWDQVNEELWQLEIPADLAKGGKTLYLPLSDEAIDQLKARRIAQEGKPRQQEYVFTHSRGLPYSKETKMTDNSWRNAAKRVGLKGITFHDMRHTWATRHVIAGTPPSALKELGGWASLDMVERYTHMNTAALRDVVNNGSNAVVGSIAITDSAA
jgi:integrase